MKIIYKMPMKSHRTSIVVSSMTIEQFEAVIAYLDSINVDWEYCKRVIDDHKR